MPQEHSPHLSRDDGRCPSCGLSPYERGIGDADISRIVAEHNSLVEQLEAAQKALEDAVWDGQRQGLQALREAISGRFPAPLVDDIFEEAEIILSASNPARKSDG